MKRAIATLALSMVLAGLAPAWDQPRFRNPLADRAEDVKDPNEYVKCCHRNGKCYPLLRKNCLVAKGTVVKNCKDCMEEDKLKEAEDKKKFLEE